MTDLGLDYFYGSEADKFSFYRLPKVLFTDARFSKLSAEAKILYGLMLDSDSIETQIKMSLFYMKFIKMSLFSI